jgi:hypothetical protein
LTLAQFTIMKLELINETFEEIINDSKIFGDLLNSLKVRKFLLFFMNYYNQLNLNKTEP